MPKITWARYKTHQGPRYTGNVRFQPDFPMDNWMRIMGVVSRCEGNIDTTVMYDGTGVTWGFQQWTFTSGRLQRLLEYLKTIPVYDFTNERVHENLFDQCFAKDYFMPDGSSAQKFRDFGFLISNGKFYDLERKVFLNPSKKAQKRRIDDICLGRARYKTLKEQKQHAIALCKVFAEAGAVFGVGEAQAEFAMSEFRRQLKYNRPVLAEFETIECLLGDSFDDLDAPVPALFWNLWMNNPRAAFKLFMGVRRTLDKQGLTYTNQEYFDLAWKRANLSTFANWGWKKGKNKSPRVSRIKKAMKEFYGLNLPYYRG